MSAGQRGGIIFGVMILAGIIFCWLVPFVVLPSIDAAMALPVIQLPGEILIKDVPFIDNFTNTAVGMLLADAIVLLIALRLRNPKMVPSGFQNLFEVVTDYMYNLTKQIAGAHKAAQIFPLVASIFLVVLIANWIELIPGVDSVGLIHCAEEGMQGYPIQNDEADAPLDEGFSISFLKVSDNLDSGTEATEADYHACEEKWFGITEHSDEEHEEEGVVAPAADEGENTESSDTEEGAAEGDTEGEETVAAVEEHEEEGAEHAEEEHGNPDLLVVTPFIRAAATDLNMTLGLALLAVVMVQFYGTQELGLSYYAKFINLPALGKVSQNPMGIMDFAVGILEIVSELSKILSFGFRLFGNIFAGQVLLFVIPFLIATLMPGAVYGLELFVGLIQAFVFFMLTLVFSGMAMTAHHGDDEEHH